MTDTASCAAAVIPPEYFFQERPVSHPEKMLLKRIFRPRSNADAHTIEFPIDWSSAARKIDRNWVMHLHGWSMFRPALQCFDGTDSATQQQIIAYFLDVIRDWHGHYGNDADNIVTSRMPEDYAWYDMSVGFRALTLAFFLNRIAAYNITVTPDDAALLESLADLHLRHLSHAEILSLNNHGIAQMHGLTALVMARGGKKADPKRYKIALQGMERLARAQFNDAGIHLEHSPHYHFYAIAAFKKALSTGWYGTDSTVVAILATAAAVGKWLVDPHKRPACIGDSTLTDMNVSFASKDRPVYRYIRSMFDSSGYHIIRSSWNTPPGQASYLFFMAAYHSKTHKHRDCLSFEWFEQGNKIICDSGKYAYTSDKNRHYCLSSAAHNSIEIDGFDILKMAPYGSALTETGMLEGGIFTVTAALEFKAFSFIRTLYYRPGKWVIIKDRLSFRKKKTFTQWLHIEKNYQLQSSTRRRAEYRRDDTGDELFIRCLHKDAASSVYCGDEEAMQGFVSERDYTIAPAPAVGFTVTAKEAECVTVLALSKKDEADALQTVIAHGITTLPSGLSIPPKQLIPGVPLYTIAPENGETLRPGKAVYRTSDSDSGIIFYADIKPGADTLTVLLPGAVDRAKHDTDMQRNSWSNEIDGHVISLADPTVSAENNLSIGWFQGVQGAYGIDRAATLIRVLCASLQINESRICFFGSSAGGFSALQLSAEFTDATAAAINPQIYLYNYSKRFFDDMLAYSYGGKPFQEVNRRFRDRISVRADLHNRHAPVYILQNTADGHHMHRHIGHYLKKLISSVYTERTQGDGAEIADAPVNIIYYDDPDNGHSPPGKEDTIAFIHHVRERTGLYTSMTPRNNKESS